jgi:hypothetical protein
VVDQIFKIIYSTYDIVDVYKMFDSKCEKRVPRQPGILIILFVFIAYISIT